MAAEAMQIILFCFLTLLLIIVSYEMKRRINIPISPCLIFVGLVFRFLLNYVLNLSAMVKLIDEMNSDVIMLAILPAILFHAAFLIDFSIIKKKFALMVPMSTSLVVIPSLVTGITFKYLLVYNQFSLSESILLGVILNATDHVGLKSLLKELHLRSKLEILLKGETLFNASTVLIIFKLLQEVILNQISPEEFVILLIRITLVGLVLGIAVSFIIGLILKRFINEVIQEFNVTIVLIYLLFWIVSYHKVEGSGSVAMAVTGFYMSAYGRTFISHSVSKILYNTWNIFVNNIECFIFIIGGIILGRFFTHNENLEGLDLLKASALFLLQHLIRGFALILHMPLFRYFGEQLTYPDLLLLTFTGIKGVLSTALALIVYDNPKFSANYSTIVLFYTLIISTFSVVFDAIISKIIVKRYKLAKASDAEEYILLGVTKRILEDTNEVIETLRNSSDFTLVKWDEVLEAVGPRRLLEEVMMASTIGRETLEKYNKESDERLVALYNNRFSLDENLYGIEIKKRYYSTLKELYWKSFYKGQCFSSSVLHLVSCCDKAIEREHATNRLWEDYEKSIYNESRINKYKKFAGYPIIGSIMRRLIYSMIINAYDISLTFLRSNNKAEDIIDSIEKDLDQNVYEDILEEAQIQIICCQDFIKEYITESYPDIIAEVQTKMASFLLLNKQDKLLTHIYEHGVIKEQEFIELKKSIMGSLKSLKSMSNPEIPTLENILKKKFRKASIEEIRKVLPSVEERHFKPEAVLFAENTWVEGGYLIISGVVHEQGELVDYEIGKGKIAGAYHLIKGNAEVYLTTATTRTVVVAAFIPVNVLNDFFNEEIYKDAARLFVLMHKDQLGLKDVEISHILKVVQNSSLLHLYSGSPVNLRRGAFVLSGRVMKDKVAFSLLRPARKIIESIEDAIVMIFPPHFGGILKQHFLLKDAFASYFIKGPREKSKAMIDTSFSVMSTFKLNQLETTTVEE